MMVVSPADAIGASDPETTILIARLFAYVVIGAAAAILLYYLAAYVEYVLAENFGYEWGYLAIGIAAAVVYGVSGVASILTEVGWLDVFTEGAVLFFILFVALGIRAMYHSERGVDHASRLFPPWVDYLVVAAFVVAWWTGFFIDESWTRPVVAVGWIAASVWAIVYAVRTVRVHEGTSLAALTRHLLPAVLCIVIIIIVDLLSEIDVTHVAFVDATWLIGTTLVGAFLFNTAVAIRQQGGQVERMYDWTTWRQQSVRDDE